MKNDRNKLLHDLLSTLINEWGFEEVYNTVQKIETKTLNRTTSRSRHETEESLLNKKKINRYSPKEMVDRLETNSEKKEILRRIADGFEKKEFLVNVADIKNFLENIGVYRENIKQRAESFRIIIKSIQEMPEDKLLSLLRNLPHYGPTRLGPLSEAIREANTSIRSNSPSFEKNDATKIDKPEK